MPTTHANRLLHETSPYLLQHARNPVDWYPWGDEAFARAAQEDKPVFLSIGYSACHWCHVMERESFEDAEVAALLNRAYISVKVDREERPDVDHFYMQAGGGGWPLTALLTQDRKPFFTGAYFPRPALLDLLNRARGLWQGDRARLLEAAEALTAGAAEQFAQGDLPEDAVQEAARLLLSRYDRRNGGFGHAPKFPSPHNLLFLMRIARDEPPESETWRAVSHTLRAMARGGLRDHLGGGFCRYSTDARWLLPHFEKMLYDNALLLMAYTEHFQKAGDPDSAQIVHETAAYVLREMTDPQTGLFYTAQDADAEGEEGLFYTFTPEEVRAALGDDAGPFCEAFDIRPGGHLEGRSVPNLLRSPHISLFDPAFAAQRKALFDARGKRVAPFRDEKALLSSNGLMIAALAKAGAVFAGEEYLRAAERAARSILLHMRGPDSRLLAVRMDGRARQAATLDGYAYFIWALIELYGKQYAPVWLEEAGTLMDLALPLFAGENGGLYFAGRDIGDLPRRGINAWDGAAPSGQSVMAMSLVRLSGLLEREDLEQRARKLIGSLAGDIAQNPAAFAFLLAAHDYLADGGTGVRVTRGEGSGALLRVLGSGYRPYLTVRLDEGQNSGAAAAHVCTGRTCYPPARTAEALAAIL